MKEAYIQLVNLTNRKKKILMFLICLFFAFEAIWIVPLKYEISVFNIVMSVSYLFSGFLLSAINVKTIPILSLIVILTNACGFVVHISLESSGLEITKEIIITDILLTYLPVFILIMAGYTFTKVFIGEHKTWSAKEK